MSSPELWAGAVVVEGDRLLVVRQTEPPDAGLWALPAVPVAEGEALAAAVVRAVEETAGLEAVCEGAAGHIELLAGGVHRVLLAFDATALGSGVLAPTATWVGLDGVATRPLVDGVPQLLADRGLVRLLT